MYITEIDVFNQEMLHKYKNLSIQRGTFTKALYNMSKDFERLNIVSSLSDVKQQKSSIG
jgi:hypothetical protein